MLNKTIHLPPEISAFFNWWGKTLVDLLPRYVRNFFSNRAEQPLFVKFTNFNVAFYKNDNDSEIELANFYFHQEGQKACNEFFNENTAFKNAKKYLLLHSKQILNKKLTLPLAASKNLTQVITYEIDRYTPFTIDNVFFTAKTVKIDNDNKQILVDFSFIGKERLNAYYNDLKKWDLVLDGIFEDKQLVNYAESDNFLPEKYRIKTSNLTKSVNQFLFVAFLILIATSVALPLWYQKQEITLLKQEIASTKRKANEVSEIKAQIDAQIQEINKISELKKSSVPVLTILSELTNLLPKKTYLKSFEYSNNKIQILGLSSSASNLISVLEDSPYFKQTNFVSPITQDAESGGQDLFQLTAQVESEKNVH